MSPRRSSIKAAKYEGPYRKPRADIYTVLLVIAVVALLIACILLYLETVEYPDKPPWSGGPSVQVPATTLVEAGTAHA